jgi:hypothetical protein
MNCPVTGEKVCRCGLKAALRLLFSDHAFYTRLVIENLLSNLPEIDVLIQRLMKNQEDIGDALASYTSKDIGARLTVLLKEHINCAATVLKNLKIQSPELPKSIDKALENSKKVAEYISSLDPNIFNYDKFKKEFDQHNQHVVDMGKLYYEKKWQAGVDLYDKYYRHMMMFSDMISDGLERKLATINGGNCELDGGGNKPSRKKSLKKNSKKNSLKGSKRGSNKTRK